MAVPASTNVNAPLLAIVGPTASGKTDWALALAQDLAGDTHAEVISADSRQVYHGLDIGTAKPKPQELCRLPHHCLDHVDPRERYHLGRFLREARAALADIHARGARPILVGGTGQYVWALLEGWDVPEVAPDFPFRHAMQQRADHAGAQALHDELRAIDPAAADRILPGNTRRVIRALEVQCHTGRPISHWWAGRDPLDATIIAPTVARDVLDARIDRRVEQMFDDGLIDETSALLDVGLAPDAPGLGSIGYREVVAYLAGDCTRQEAIAAIQQATSRLARRQNAWFRPNDPRIHWCDSPTAARRLLDTPRSAPGMNPHARPRTITP